MAWAILLSASAAPAHATFIADAPDPAGDAASPDPGHDLLAIGLGYDRASGQLAGAVALRGDPDMPGFVALVAATRTSTGCDEGPAIGFGSALDDFDAIWLRQDSGTVVTAHGEADKQGAGRAIQRFEVTDEKLARLRPDCVTVSMVDPANPQTVYDTAGPVELVPKPGLAIRLRGVPEKVRSGRAYRLKVAVSNPGDAPTGKIRLRLSRAKGLKAPRRAVTVKSVRPGKKKTATFTVTLSRRARFATDLKMSAKAGRLRATAEKQVYVQTPRRKGSGGGGNTGTPGTCIKFFPDFSGDTGGSLGLVPCVR